MTEEIAIEAMAAGDGVEISRWEDGTIMFGHQTPTVGLIFYPGGKVEHTAYAPLMRACAERGILCVLVKMPCNLAVLDVNAADGIEEQFPQIERWYIGGHSLGGAMAASYAAKHSDTLDGLILLAAYSMADLADTDLAVVSLYGSEDGVLNRENTRNIAAICRRTPRRASCKAAATRISAATAHRMATAFQQSQMSNRCVGRQKRL